MSVYDDVLAFRKMAVAVIERAALDLSLMSTRYTDEYRQDAVDFLTQRLWEDDCLWNLFLNGAITQPKMCRLVKQKLKARRL